MKVGKQPRILADSPPKLKAPGGGDCILISALTENARDE
jgi:hypothetical protein